MINIIHTQRYISLIKWELNFPWFSFSSSSPPSSLPLPEQTLSRQAILSTFRLRSPPTKLKNTSPWTIFQFIWKVKSGMFFYRFNWQEASSMSSTLTPSKQFPRMLASKAMSKLNVTERETITLTAFWGAVK